MQGGEAPAVGNDICVEEYVNWALWMSHQRINVV